MTGKSKSETGEALIRVLQADEIDTVSGGWIDPITDPLRGPKVPGWTDPNPQPVR